MKAKLAWCLAGLCAFVFFLIMYLPASQVTNRLPLPANVQVYGIDGTLWQGRAQQVRINGLPVDNVRWQLHPLALLTGTVRATLQGGNMRSAEAVSFNGPVSTGLFSQDRFAASDFTLYLPVDQVLAQVPLPLPVNASGRFKLRINELEYAGRCDTLDGQGSWLNAAVAGTQGPISFGTYNATLGCADGDFLVAVTPPNKLGLSMQAQFTPQPAQFSVEGRFKPDADLPEEVHQAARFFGQPDAEGYTRFKL